MNELLKEKLESIFRDISVSIPEGNRLIIDAKKDEVLTILRFLKDRGYDHLALISCVDWLEEKEFELVYILSSYSNMERDKNNEIDLSTSVLVKTRIPRERGEFISAIHVFNNAEPYEREIHELFGINFEGHPRLTPLFLEREYKIPPFRKDFDTRKYVEETFNSIPTIEEVAYELK